MADNRYTACINGRPVNCSTVSDGIEKSIVAHEFPNRNGAMLEDLGLNARTITIITHWREANYEEHKGFLRDLTKVETVEFIHPAYGPLQGKIRSAHIRHDDGVNYCEIAIEFIEDSESLSQLSVSPDIADRSERLFVEGEQQQIELAGTSIFGAVNNFLAAVENGMRAFDGIMVNAELPADSIISAIDYGTSLPGRFVESVANCVARYAQAYKATINSPVAFINSMNNGFRKLQESVDSFAISGSENAAARAARTLLSQHLGLAAAQQLCLQTAYLFEAEEIGRNVLRQQETRSAFDMEGNFIRPEIASEIMNVRELDYCLAIIRKFCAERIGIFGTIDEASSREVPAIKEMCAALLYYVKTIKIEMEKIIEIDVDPAMPLHLVCLNHGLPYPMAERVLSINNIDNPNKVIGRIKIYVR
jgi:hypothetical protein